LIPHFKIETNNYTLEDTAGEVLEVVLPENDVSYAVAHSTNKNNNRYIGVFDDFNEIDISIKRGSGQYTQVFGGHITNLRPALQLPSGDNLVVSAWGHGEALDQLHCDTDFGAESANPSKDTIQEVIQELITNYVNEDFNSGNTTHWDMVNTTVENVLSAFTITSLTSPYLPIKELINRACMLGSAYAAGAATVGPHWRVSPDNKLYMKLINASSTDGTWLRYWKLTQEKSTIEVAQKQILYDFQDPIQEYANQIVLASAFRKPASDIWSEDNGPTWGNLPGTEGRVLWSYSDTQKIVGSHSLKLVDTIGNPGGGGYVYYPSTADAAWDFTKCGSSNTIPHLNFYLFSDQGGGGDWFDNYVILAKDMVILGGADEYFWCQLNTFITGQANKWFHISLPIGPYWGLDPALSSTVWEWQSAGASTTTWSQINYVMFGVDTAANCTGYIDDLHFSGKVVRVATDNSEVTSTKKLRQKFLRLDTATDDTLLESADTGTCAMLAYAELLRRARRTLVGKIEIPGDETTLPGQTVHVHACKRADGSFRVDKDMRIKEVRHRVSTEGFKTQLSLTDDVTNSLAFSVPSNYSLLKQYAMTLGHAEARDLKASGVDSLIPRLVKSY